MSTTAYKIVLVKETRRNFPDATLNSSEEVSSLAYKYNDGADREKITVYAVNSQNTITGIHTAFTGTVDSCFCYSREVFKFAILANACSIIVCHNHPSGNVQASPADINMTKSLLRAAESLQIPILDHIIIGNMETASCNRYFSFQREYGELWTDAKAAQQTFELSVRRPN